MFIRFFGFLIASALLLANLSALADLRPNMIFILMDDFGYNDLGVQTYPTPENYYPDAGPSPQLDVSTPDPDIPAPNHARLLTPELDNLAATGLRLTSFHSSSSCSPSRASLMTGRYDRRVSINSVFFPYQTTGLNTHEVTLPELLRENGYATAMIGKWHLGYSVASANPMQYLPCRHGFEEFFGVPHSNDMSDFCLIEDETIVDPDFKIAEKQAQLIWRYTEWALDYLQRKTRSKQPFFLYLANSMPHIPVYPSDREFTNADGTKWPKFQGSSGVSWYYDVVKEVDYSIGKIRNKLIELGIADNTIVMFTSDNGPWVRYSNINLQQNAVGCAYPLRNSKGTTWEGGCRVPFIVNWPGYVPPGRVSNELSGLVDILPTLVGLAGGWPPTDRVIDGVDLWPLWSGVPDWVSPRSSYAIFGGSGLDAVLKDNWKWRQSKLYNLSTDIQEQIDQAAAFPIVLAEMEMEKQAVEDSIAADRQERGVFSAFEVVLEADSLRVTEGDTANLGLVLSADPGMSVTVDVDWFSGDTDLILNDGAQLSFDSGNWSVTQQVSFAALPDTDLQCGGATFRVTSPQINVVREIFVFENDIQRPASVQVERIWPSVSEITLVSNTVKLVAQASAMLEDVTNSPAFICQWSRIAGPGEVYFSDPDDFETGVAFECDGSYRLRFMADHPDAADYGAFDFTVNVALFPGPEADLRFAPPIAYDAAYNSGETSVWKNLIVNNQRDWTLASNVLFIADDPAPDCNIIDAAFEFQGGTIPAGGSSLHLDAYSTANASVELWFKPSVWPVDSQQILWESGGDIGSSLTLSGNELFFAVDDGSANLPQGAVASAAFAPSVGCNGFVHCVGVIDLNNDQIHLYIDGVKRDTRAIPLVNDWCGGSYSGLATIVDSNGAESINLGHLGGNDLLPTTGYQRFGGQIAILRIYDQALSQTQVVELTHPPAATAYNFAPLVAAGNNQSVAYSMGAELTGSVSDDNLPANAVLTTLWRQRGGVGKAVFANAASPVTTCSFDLPGVYKLWIESHDSEIKVYDETVVAVAPLTYSEWTTIYDLTPGTDGVRDNPDDDMFVNIWEWALGLDPLIADNAGAFAEKELRLIDDKAYFSLSFDVPRNRRPVVQLQGSADLVAWSLLSTAVPQILLLDETKERWLFTLEKELTSAPRYFIRPVVILDE